VEMHRTLERDRQGSVKILPVILRECDWRNAPFGDILAVPTDGKPIEDFSRRDKAYMEVVKVIRKAIVDQSHPILPSSNIAPDSATLVQQLRAQQSEKIKHNYGKIRLLNGKNIDVDRIYVDVYILERLSKSRMNTIDGMLRGFDPMQDRLAMSPRKDRKPGFEVANSSDKLMVLGKPGGGKSTFLCNLAIACCNGEFQGNRIPVLLELKEIRNFDQCDLVRLVQEELELIDESQYKQILNHGNILLLLDGLDEVSEHLRQTVQNNIQWFCKTYFKSYVVLTCRTQTVEHILESFDCIEVADFTSEQIEQFAQNWFMALAKSPEDGTVQAKDFISKLMKPEHRQTAELAITPMLGDFRQKRHPSNRSDENVPFWQKRISL